MNSRLPKREKNMFGKSKHEVAKQSQHAGSPQAAKVARTMPSFQQSDGGAEPIYERQESCIGVGTTIVGRIVSDGVVRIFGRVEGDFRVANLLIGDGAQVEGNVIAEQLTIAGNVKGTIHAIRVKLSGSAAVAGDIYHRSLSIEENARFEGASRPTDNPVDVLTDARVRDSKKASTDANSKLSLPVIELTKSAD
jgi:cytoskeletal protein CcmA (bactofilin family)